MLDTYLMTAPPGRRGPTPADALDVATGGVRVRFRERGAQSLLDALPLAAVLALSAAAFLGSVWLLWVELVHPFPSDGSPRWLAFNSAAAVAWIGWMLAAGVFAVAPQATRVAVGVALVATFVAVPIERVIAAMSSWDIAGFWYLPPVQVVVPQLALGVLALAAPVRPGPIIRWAPFAAIVAAFAARLADRLVGGDGPNSIGDLHFYRTAIPAVFSVTAWLMLAAGLAVAIGLGLRRDARAPWVPLLVLVPAGLMLACYWAHTASYYPEGSPTLWQRLAVANTTSVVVTVGLLAAAVVVTGGNRSRRRVPDGPER